MSRRRPSAVARGLGELARVRGAYSLLFLTADSLIAVRDPLGFRPLILGRLRGAWVFASETCALDRDVDVILPDLFGRRIGPRHALLGRRRLDRDRAASSD